MTDLADFLAMGGYAAYVWPSFALTAVVLGAVVIGSLVEHRRVRTQTFRRARQSRRERT